MPGTGHGTWGQVHHPEPAALVNRGQPQTQVPVNWDVEPAKRDVGWIHKIRRYPFHRDSRLVGPASTEEVRVMEGAGFQAVSREVVELTR